MSTFIQLHLLTSYPPANLNRDDLGRPKTAIMGGVQRLRISSQSLKRAWRTSPLFEEALDGYVGTRTKEMGVKIFQDLTKAGVNEKKARKWAKSIAEQFGKLKGNKDKKPNQDLEIEQLAHFSPEEIKGIETLTKALLDEDRDPEESELTLLRKKNRAVDIALFGRMLADAPRFNMEAAAQVAHAITVHKVTVEDDYFTTVDDLNEGEEDMGAGHIGEREFAAGLFYLYVCINRDLLAENLQTDQCEEAESLVTKTLRAFTEAAVKIAPIGMQNSFASRAYASYVLAEKGRQQPRSLSVAFLKPVSGNDVLSEATTSLEKTQDNMNKVYGKVSDTTYTLNAVDRTGSFDDLLDFVAKPLEEKESARNEEMT
ncbi:MAG: type I-E CRISPR-associated protein Cas7/Cse4/CasC [Nitrospiria bacterium]